MAVNLRGALSSLLAEIRAGLNGDNALVTSPEATQARAGFSGSMGIVDPGAVVTGGIRREIDVSGDFRQRVGSDTVFWQDVFQYTTINASAYAVVTSTMTITQAGGFLNLNAGAAVATGNHVVLRTWRTFPIVNSAPTYLYFAAVGTNQIAQNAVVEVGLGYALTTAAPTDGVFFRWNIDGELRGVVVNNSVEAQTSVLTRIGDTVRGEYLIVVNDEGVEFWIDGVLRGVVDAVSTWSGMGPVQSTSLPFLARCYNSGTATAPKRLNISEVNVTLGDLSTTRLWATQMAGMELGGYQSPPGAAASQTAQWANSAAPASAILSNTAAGYTTKGGIFQFAAVAGAETDYALFAYQVPAGSVTQPGKNLVIRGVRIDLFNAGAAVATTAHTFMWAIGVGSSAVSLATTDSLTAAGRAPRRIPLGVQWLPVGAAIGQAASPIDVNLDAPLLVPAGAFVHVILRMPVGTATASQVIRGTVTFNDYFE
jgi:hypothetical protein